MVNIESIGTTLPAANGGLGTWETTLYVGLIGTVFIADFGIFRWLAPYPHKQGYQQMFLPVIGLTILSLEFPFGNLHDLLPSIFDGVRVVSRTISLPLTFLLVMDTSTVANTMTAFDETTVQQGTWFVANHADRAYFRYLGAGLAGTIFSLAVLTALVIWERKRRTSIVATFLAVSEDHRPSEAIKNELFQGSDHNPSSFLDSTIS